MKQKKCTICKTTPCICNRPETKVSPTGALRDDEGTPKFILVPRGPMVRVAARFEHGVVKYGRDNWKKGLDSEECMNHGLDHLAKFNDSDRSEDHLAAAVWNLLVIMWNQENQSIIEVKS